MRDSKVDMYRQMKPPKEVDWNIVFEKDNRIPGENKQQAMIEDMNKNVTKFSDKKKFIMKEKVVEPEKEQQ